MSYLGSSFGNQPTQGLSLLEQAGFSVGVESALS